jgi:hypothetical protein
MAATLRLAGALALLSLLACRSAQQTGPSGPGTGTHRDLTGFSSVEIGGAIEATVSAGPAFSVTVSGDPAAVANVVTRVKGETLVVGREGSGNQGRVKVAIALPVLRGVELSGASDATVSGLSGDGVRLEASGASRLRANDIKGAHLALDASGASTVDLSGALDDLVTDVSGASHVRARELTVRKVVVDVSGASTLELSGRDISGDASGASTVQVWGAPERLAVETTGASSVRRM